MRESDVRPRPTPAETDRFWRSVQPGDNCWLWTGARVRFGYGTLWWPGGPIQAHRFAWVLAHGELPEGQFIRHRCDVPNCVNVEHLFLGTQQENIADRHAKGRRTSGQRGNAANLGRVSPEQRARGEQHGLAKVRADHVREMRQRLARGQRQAAIARDYGVTKHTVQLIAKGRVWKEAWA
jgi:hypothetical protein